jgi:hypothetical protein
MAKRNSTIETLYGATNGTATTGTLPLQSALTETTLGGSTPETYSQISIPKGLRARIWAQKVAGAAATITVNFNANPAGATSVLYTMPTNAVVATDATDLAAAGTVELDDKRPLALDGYNPGTALAQMTFTWSQATAAVSYWIIKIEWIPVWDAESESDYY